MGTRGRIQDFKLGGGTLKKLCRAEGCANIFGVFRVKNHNFTPKNHIFPNCGGRSENFWDISCEKSRFYAKKSYFFSNFRGARAGCATLDPPLLDHFTKLPKPTYTRLEEADVTSLLNSICNFDFVVTIVIVQMCLAFK